MYTKETDDERPNKISHHLFTNVVRPIDGSLVETHGPYPQNYTTVLLY
jgi:hypothetical protein